MKLLRRVLGVLGRATLFVVITLLVAEVALQIASRFAHSRATGWRADAAHRILCVGDSHTYGVLVPPE